MVPISALIRPKMGIWLCRGNLLGKIPPSSFRKRFPARITCGLANAVAPTNSESPAATTATRIKCLLMLLPPCLVRWDRADLLWLRAAAATPIWGLAHPGFIKLGKARAQSTVAAQRGLQLGRDVFERAAEEVLDGANAIRDRATIDAQGGSGRGDVPLGSKGGARGFSPRPGAGPAPSPLA